MVTSVASVTLVSVSARPTLASNPVRPADDKDKFSVSAKPIATVRAIYASDGFVDEVAAGESTIGLVLDRTSYFAQAGGQVADLTHVTT